MTEISMRCRAEDHEAALRFEQWLGEKRAASPILMTDGSVRVSRLTPALATVRGGARWLIEFELQEDGSPIDWQSVAALVTDLRLLGLAPTVLIPRGISNRSRSASCRSGHRGTAISVSVEASRTRRAGGGSTVDQMSEGSFPASDPPAVWTWETNQPTPEGATEKAPGSLSSAVPEARIEERE
jgi:hypothetical protein